MITALVAAAGIASTFVGNAVFLIPSSNARAFALRLDTGGYDLVTAAAAQRVRLKPGAAAHLQSGDRGTFELPQPSALSADLLLQARPGALESTFVEPVDGTLGLGRFAAQPLTIDFPHKTVTLGEVQPGGDRVTMTVGLGPPAIPGLAPTAFALVPVTIDGERIMMLLDTGADVAIDAAHRASFDDAAATRSLPLITTGLFERLRARQPGWSVLTGAAHMAESKGPVTLLRVAEFTIGTHRAPPTWFAVREDAETYANLTRMFAMKVEGDLGGEALRAWRVTIDVPHEALIVH
ncbi:MAG: hypothetical protein QOF71_3324 [Candidatus Eremiobacteraeota bacterium]|jgi:hypothetical protein|nr:hypothetical protein [Candidatus Eremiobacteraeota bacterium]